jgi:outer membrane protein assembly factor BamB
VAACGGEEATTATQTVATTAQATPTTTQPAGTTTVGRLGELVWKFQTGGPVGSSPAVSGGVVYFGSLDYNLYAVNTQGGQQKWNFKTDDAVVSCPAISGGVVYVGSRDTYFYAAQ